MKSIQSGAVTVIAALALGAVGYFAGQANAQPPQPLSEGQYNAALPHDVHPDSRGRLPLIKREVLDEEGKRDYDRHIGPKRSSLAGLQGPGGLRLHGSKPDGIGEDLGGRLKELIRLIVSRELDQAFEWTVHEPVALREELEPSIIDVIRHRKSLAGVPEKEAAMIQLGR